MPYHTRAGIGCLAVLSLFSQQILAGDFYEEEDSLRLRLRNELRRADKPSAGPDSNIYAWVQGAALEYNSAYAGDVIGLDAGAFRTQRLDTHDDWSTRWYLDGQESFTLYTAAVKVKLSDRLKLKVGRMVTDSAYSGQEDIPLINVNSQRTQPTLSEGALLKFSLNPNIDIYGMVRSKVYYYPDVSIGLHTSGPVNPRTYQYDTYRPQYLTSTLYRNKLDTYALSVSWQEDVAAQIMTKASQRYAVSADGRSYFKPEWLGLYAKLNGVSSGEHSAKDTYVLGAKLSYINDTGNGFVAVGKAGPKFSWLSGVDTDISYTYDLSIDRNHSNMFSWQVGYLWNLPNDMLLGLAQLYTDGHEDRHNNVKIRGAATGIIAGYNPRSGAMKGLRSMLILSSARESREGSQLGDHLDYFDIKLNLQYDFNLR